MIKERAGPSRRARTGCARGPRQGAHRRRRWWRTFKFGAKRPRTRRRCSPRACRSISPRGSDRARPQRQRRSIDGFADMVAEFGTPTCASRATPTTSGGRARNREALREARAAPSSTTWSGSTASIARASWRSATGPTSPVGRQRDRRGARHEPPHRLPDHSELLRAPVSNRRRGSSLFGLVGVVCGGARAVGARSNTAVRWCRGRAAPARRGRPASAADVPSLVVLVVVDQLRADYLHRLGPTSRRRFQAAPARRGRLPRALRPAEHVHRPGPRAHRLGLVRVPERHHPEQVVQPRARPLGGDALRSRRRSRSAARPTPEDETLAAQLHTARRSATSCALASAWPSRVVALAAQGARRASSSAAGSARRTFSPRPPAQMTSSTYYGPSLPAWVAAFNAAEAPPTQSFGKTWERAAAGRSLHPRPDDVACTRAAS